MMARLRKFLKVNDIKAKMIEYKELKGEELINKIFDNREKKIVNTVKRVIPRIKHLEL